MYQIEIHVDVNIILLHLGTFGKETVSYNGKVVSVIKGKWSEALKSDHTHVFAEFEQGKLAHYEMKVKGSMKQVTVLLTRDGQVVGALESTMKEIMRRKKTVITSEGVSEAASTDSNDDPTTAAPPATGSEPDGKWWQTALLGVFLIGCAVALYFYFVNFENSTDSTRRMKAIIAMLYNMGGKWLACGLIGGLGVLMLAISHAERRKQK